MKYVVLMAGEGHGCDYTIDCNKTFMIFEAKDDEEAIERCKKRWEEFGTEGSEPRVKNIELFCVERTVGTSVKKWVSDEIAKQEKIKLQMQIEEAEAKINRLKNRLKAVGLPM